MFTYWKGMRAVALVGKNGERAIVTFHGAHVVEFAPQGMDDILFISGKSDFQPGKPIRGGVPICFPWFGAAPDGQSGSHGFVRNSEWELLSDTGYQAIFGFEAADFRLIYTVTLEESLQLKLQIENISGKDFTYSGALHTYFKVGNVSDITINGVDNATYLDSLTGKEEVQDTPLCIDREIDRAYRSSATVTLCDPAFNRVIEIAKSGSNSTVIWNPWIAKSQRMPDFGDGEYPGMICVEAANVPGIGDAQTLAKGGKAELCQTISVRKQD